MDHLSLSLASKMNDAALCAMRLDSEQECVLSSMLTIVVVPIPITSLISCHDGDDSLPRHYTVYGTAFVISAMWVFPTHPPAWMQSASSVATSRPSK